VTGSRNQRKQQQQHGCMHLRMCFMWLAGHGFGMLMLESKSENTARRRGHPFANMSLFQESSSKDEAQGCSAAIFLPKKWCSCWCLSTATPRGPSGAPDVQGLRAPAPSLLLAGSLLPVRSMMTMAMAATAMGMAMGWMTLTCPRFGRMSLTQAHCSRNLDLGGLSALSLA